VPQKQWDVKTNERTDKLLDLAGDIKAEELEMQADEGWVDKQKDMIEKDMKELEGSVWPIWVLLTKVSKWVKKVLYSICDELCSPPLT
jgi:hypothetical protein